MSLSLSCSRSIHSMYSSFYLIQLFNEIKPFLPNTDKLKIHFAKWKALAHRLAIHSHSIPIRIIEIHLQRSNFGTVAKLNWMFQFFPFEYGDDQVQFTWHIQLTKKLLKHEKVVPFSALGFSLVSLPFLNWG